MVFKLDAIASIGSAVALVIHEPAGGNKMTATTVEQPAGGGLAWYALSASDVTTQMGADADTGLTVVEVERRQAEYGPNELGQVAEIESTGLVPKDPGTLPGGETALGDRTNLAQRTRMDHRPRPVPRSPPPATRSSSCGGTGQYLMERSSCSEAQYGCPD